MSYIKKFNPYDLPEETLKAIATGRERVLEDILSLIARNAEGGLVQHLQVVAPRGYGKSFLMRLVQSALRERVAEGLPVALALLPEEQHNVDAPHRLLNEIQRVLEGRPAESLLGGAFSESEGAWEAAVAALDEAIHARLPAGRGIAVAIVENFDQLMADVFSKPQDQSRLRKLMDRKGGRLMLLATATRQADADYEQRLFQATRVIELEPWKEEYCLAFFEKLRGRRQAGPMSPRTRGKARAIAQFIGGSPRMATVLAEVLDSNDSLQAARMLDALVDELTPYYKHRIESLSRRARTLLDALLRMGEPRTQSEIAVRLGTVQPRIAEPFNELRARGEVVGVKAQHSAEVLYRVGDRLMAHYYRRRHLNPGEATSLLEAIVELLADFYTPEEKQAEAERLRALGHTADAAVMDRLVAEERARVGSGRSGMGGEDEKLDPLGERVVALVNAGHIDEAIALCREVAQRAEASGDLREQVLSQRYLGGSLYMKGSHTEAEDTVRRALILAERVGDLRNQAALSRYLSWCLGARGRHEEAEEVLRRAVALAEQAGAIRERMLSSGDLGWSLGQRGRHEEAEEVLRRAVALAERAGDLREQAVSSRYLGWSLGERGRHEEAEEVLRRAVALAEQVGDLSEQATSSRHLGWSLGQRGRHEEAAEVLRRAVALAEQAGDASESAWAAVELLKVAKGRKNDVIVVMSWQHAIAAAAVAPDKKNLPNIVFWFDDAAAAALRIGQFGTVWSSAASLPGSEVYLGFAQRSLAAAIAQTSRDKGRAAAYGLAVHAVEVLLQDAADRATRGSPAGPEPIAFLRGMFSSLTRRLSDPALLRDLVALLEERLPSETETERTLLEAAARSAEQPGDPAVLERMDPDIATFFKRIRISEDQPASKPPPRRGKRSGKTRRKR